MYKIERNSIKNAEQEILELKRLLLEAQLRLRFAQHRNGTQGWWDWLWENLGF